MQLPHYYTSPQMRGVLAQIVPAWFSDDLDREDVARFLELTLADAAVWSAPDDIVVVADGQERVAQAAEDVANEHPECACRVVRLEANQGKAGAFAAGMQACLANPKVTHVAVRDADGDHLSSDLPNLYRLARQMQEELHTETVIVVAGRPDVNLPMGLERGEYEQLLNDVVWNALTFARARQGEAVNTQFWGACGQYPDLQSGFKLYTRESGRAAAAALADAHEHDPAADVYRWGCELAPIVEIVAAGGVLGQVMRQAISDQPVIAYGGIVRHKVYADKAAWCLKRLRLPPNAAKQILDNALVRRPLYRAQAYRGELLQMRGRVLAAVGAKPSPPPACSMLS